MGARQVGVLVVAAAFLIAMGNTSADECQDVGVRVPSVTLVMDSPAESNEAVVHLNASVKAPNSTVVFIISPAESNEPGVHLICITPDSAPLAPTPAPVPRPPPEPKWPTVTSLTADILSPSAVHVYWTTNLPTVGRVIWGPWGHERTGTADSERFGTAHGVWLLDLRAGETYSPHVIVFDGKAQAELSDEVVFTMPMPARDHGADAVLVAILAASTLGVCDVLRRSTK